MPVAAETALIGSGDVLVASYVRSAHAHRLRDPVHRVRRENGTPRAAKRRTANPAPRLR
jgi:hypothetical protein